MRKIPIKRQFVAPEPVLLPTLPEAVASHPLLSGVSTHTQIVLANCLQRRELRAGAYLFRHGDPVQAVYLLTEGVVRTLHGKMESAWLSSPGTLGMGEVLADCDRMQEGAQAVEPSTLWMLPREPLRVLVTRDAHLLLNLSRALAQRHLSGIRNEKQAMEPGFVRVANYLATLSARTGESQGDCVLVRTTQQAVADGSGLTPRTIARVLKEMRKTGRVRVARGEYLLRQPETLAQLAL